MLAVLTSILGFFGPFIPQALKIWQSRQDNLHELQLLKLQAEIAEKQQRLKIEEINTQADIAEATAIRTPQQSFGVQLLDAAKGQGMPAWIWTPVFWAFALLDLLAGLVRPLITYTVVSFWLVYKYAVVNYAKESMSGTWQDAILTTWNSDDTAVLFLVLGYWFGQRAMKAVFGGSASTGKPGA